MIEPIQGESLVEYIKAIEQWSPLYSLSRGQSQDYSLLPSSLRQDSDGMRIYSKFDVQSFLEDFKSNSSVYIESASTYNEHDWLIHAQHFGVPTCLLDFTYSHLVSLMFALEKAFEYSEEDDNVDKLVQFDSFDAQIEAIQICLKNSFIENSAYTASSTNSKTC